MANVLFVKANNRPADQSPTVQLYDAFLQNYKEANPSDQITELNLFEVELPYYDNNMMNGLFKLANGYPVSAEEQQMADVANKYLDQFMAADKVVFAFPLWNFTVPAQLVTYIGYLSQAGKTFKYTAEGPVGLMTDKKVALLNARGGVYSEGPAASLEMSMNFVKAMLGLWGINNAAEVVIEGHNQFPDRKDQIIADGLKAATELASKF